MRQEENYLVLLRLVQWIGANRVKMCFRNRKTKCSRSYLKSDKEKLRPPFGFSTHLKFWSWCPPPLAVNANRVDISQICPCPGQQPQRLTTVVFGVILWLLKAFAAVCVEGVFAVKLEQSLNTCAGQNGRNLYRRFCKCRSAPPPPIFAQIIHLRCQTEDSFLPTGFLSGESGVSQE